jgi:hypothetical protein
MKENKKSDNPISYKMYKQKADKVGSNHDLTVNSEKALELITALEVCKDRYKRLKVLGAKNDEVVYFMLLFRNYLLLRRILRHLKIRMDYS